MRQFHCILPVALLLAISTLLTGQSDFSHCAAAFLNQTMIVDDYSPEGKCVVAAAAAGELTVRPVTLEAGKDVIAGEKIPFKIALRDGVSKTLISFSEETYREIDLRQVLKRCKKGDAIVLITVERAWALPHSELRVQ